jgi:hypothetical protein
VGAPLAAVFAAGVPFSGAACADAVTPAKMISSAVQPNLFENIAPPVERNC